MTADVPLKAIPTIYNGVQLKSRMEAQCALFFDILKWQWEYEAVNLMLLNGVTYTPDFWLPEFRTVVECRGYESEKGLRQIIGFRHMLQTSGFSGKFKRCNSYLTIGPDVAEIVSVAGSHILTGARISWCHRCQRWIPDGYGIGWCNDCRGSECFLNIDLCVYAGKVLIAEKESEEWDQLALTDSDNNNRLALASAIISRDLAVKHIEELRGMVE